MIFQNRELYSLDEDIRCFLASNEFKSEDTPDKQKISSFSANGSLLQGKNVNSQIAKVLSKLLLHPI